MKFTTFEPAQSHYKLNQKSVQGDLGHTPYKKNINYEKCAGIGLNGFIFEITDEKYCTNGKKRSWEPFRICLLNSTANPANFHPNWAGLAVLLNLAGKS